MRRASDSPALLPMATVVTVAKNPTPSMACLSVTLVPVAASGSHPRLPRGHCQPLSFWSLTTKPMKTHVFSPLSPLSPLSA
jgi:hypothetical protein